jgi:hypothetical protein
MSEIRGNEADARRRHAQRGDLNEGASELPIASFD